MHTRSARPKAALLALTTAAACLWGSASGSAPTETELAPANSAVLAPPVAPTIPVVDDYFGTRVTDPYRWMENRADPRFVAWLKAEDAYAHAVLARIPGLDALQARIAATGGSTDKYASVHRIGSRLFYLKRPAGAEIYSLYVRDADSAPERLLVDPSRFAGTSTHGAIDYFVASPDGARVAVSVSTGGSENGVLRVVETETARVLPDAIDRVPYGAPSWLPDASGFFYNRFAAILAGAPETEKYFNSRAMLHRLGTPTAADVALVGTGVPGSPELTKVDTPYVVATPGSRWALAFVSHGATPANDVLVAPLAELLAPAPHPAWRRVASLADQVTDAVPIGERLFVLTHHDAPRYTVLELDAGTGTLARARVAIPAGERVIERMAVARDAVFVQDLAGGLGSLRRLDLATGAVTPVELPGAGSASELAANPATPGATFALGSWLAPDRHYGLAATGTATAAVPAPAQAADLGLDAPPAPALGLSRYVAEEVRARSWDGTQVPLSIVHRRDLRLDGRNPVLLTGYGAYGYALKPAYLASYLPFLEDGGVYAVAHVRGGGEFGEDWHLAGFQATKPNTYKDLVACAEYLDQRGYGSPATTAILGGSAGGITVGMATTARPDLFRVVVDRVGDNNTLRAEAGTDGAANAMEYGSTATKPGFEALAAVDATQHVRPGTAYPAVFLTTGYNDPRVAPFQPGKMAAHLQAASSSGRPVILRVDFDAGHGVGSTRSQRERELAEMLGFFYWQMGRPGYQPAGSGAAPTSE